MYLFSVMKMQGNLNDTVFLFEAVGMQTLMSAALIEFATLIFGKSWEEE